MDALKEFGATTGRARRCGWIDLVALNTPFASTESQLMMMKGDVLSGFSSIKVCTHYKTKQGKIEHFPFSIEPENVAPVYIELPGWKEDLTQMSTEEEFPTEFANYINFLEKELETPIKIVLWDQTENRPSLDHKFSVKNAVSLLALLVLLLWEQFIGTRETCHYH